MNQQRKRVWGGWILGTVALVFVMSGITWAETPQEVVARYQNTFDYSFDLPEGWQLVPVNKFQARLEPDTDKSMVGVTFTADILNDAFGTGGFDLEAYRKHLFQRISAVGYPVSSAAPFDGLQVGKDWSAWSMIRPDGKGRELFIFTRKGDLVFYHDVVFIADFDRYFKKYKGQIETIVNQTQIDVQ